jgi:hypothetical protein
VKTPDPQKPSVKTPESRFYSNFHHFSFTAKPKKSTTTLNKEDSPNWQIMSHWKKQHTQKRSLNQKNAENLKNS